MKKLILFVIILILTQCQIKVETKNASANEFPFGYIGNSSVAGRHGELFVTSYEKEGIQYLIFRNDGYDGKSIFVVNHTKEKLEVEYLRLQIKKLRKEQYGN